MIRKNSQGASRNLQALRSTWPAKLVAFVLLFAQLAWAVPAWADPIPVPPVPSSTVLAPIVPTIVPVRPGDRILWPGLLLNAPAIAQIKVDLDSAKEQCDITIKKEVDTTVANWQYKLDVQVATSTREKSEVDAALKSRTAEAIDLQKRLAQSEKDRPNVYLWTGLGVAGGVILTVLTVFAVSKASK